MIRARNRGQDDSVIANSCARVQRGIAHELDLGFHEDHLRGASPIESSFINFHSSNHSKMAPQKNEETSTVHASLPDATPVTKYSPCETPNASLKPIKNGYNLDVEHAPIEHPELNPVFPTTTYDPIPVLPYDDRAAYADPTLKNLLANATVTHLAPKIGTEIDGVQLHELTDAQKDELALPVAERGVVFLRDQEINLEQQLELGKYYGPLHIQQNLGQPEDHPEVVVVQDTLEISDETARRHLYDPVAGWHSDVTYERQPPWYTSFKLLTAPPEGGDTLWSSSCEAYERLTPPFQKFLEGLTAIHSGKKQAEGAAARGFTVRRPVVEFEHPVIRTHPVTKRKALFVNFGFTTRIKQLSRGESALCSAFCSLMLPRDMSSKCATAGLRTLSRSGTTASPAISRLTTTCQATATPSGSLHMERSHSSRPSSRRRDQRGDEETPVAGLSV